jgi:hypothetical protein
VEEELTEEERRARFLHTTLRDIACKLTCIVVTQPLQVMLLRMRARCRHSGAQVVAVRAMAEFVGGDTKYSGGLTLGLYGGLCEILRENGLVGLWSGVVPRALGEVGILATTAGITFLVNNYVVSEKEMRQYTGHVAGFLAGSLFYPFQVGTSPSLSARCRWCPPAWRCPAPACRWATRPACPSTRAGWTACAS